MREGLAVGDRSGGVAGFRTLPVVLDGATSTELQRRGYSVAAPWWSSEVLRTEEGRGVVRRVHEDFLDAGAEVITANTFRTNRYALMSAGADEREADALVAAALTAAREARDAHGGRATVAASVAPVRDCYQPELVPDEATLRAEHSWHVQRLVDEGAELLLIETMNSCREALVALAQAERYDVPAWVSFVCAPGGVLLSGEDVRQAASAVSQAGAAVVLVNCTPPAAAREALAAVGDLGVPIGCYLNVEDRSAIPGNQHVDRYVPAAHAPAALGRLFAELVSEFDLGVVGGCCGTSPDHLRAVAEACRPAS